MESKAPSLYVEKAYTSSLCLESIIPLERIKALSIYTFMPGVCIFLNLNWRSSFSTGKSQVLVSLQIPVCKDFLSQKLLSFGAECSCAWHYTPGEHSVENLNLIHLTWTEDCLPKTLWKYYYSLKKGIKWLNYHTWGTWVILGKESKPGNVLVWSNIS